MADDSKANTKSVLRTAISVFGPAPILEGEDGNAYDELLERVSSDMKPKGIIEEIFVRDFVDLTWEILRGRRLMVGRLSRSVVNSLSEYLGRIIRRKPKEGETVSLAYSPPTPPSARKLAKKWAAGDRAAIDRVNKIMAAAGETVDAVTADVLIDNLDSIERIDRMITIAEGRRSSILRELDRHRAALAENLRATLKDVEEAEFEIVKPVLVDVDEKAP